MGRIEEPIDRYSTRYHVCLTCHKEYMTKLAKQNFYSATRSPGNVIVDFTIGDLNPSKDSIIY